MGIIENVFLNAKVSLPQHETPSSSIKANFPYRLGERVQHARFGEGVVTAGDGEGESARVQVNFQSCGKKWLVVSYAKLAVCN